MRGIVAVEATCAGVVDARTGMVVNMTDLKQALKGVLDELDHRHLDNDVPHFRTVVRCCACAVLRVLRIYLTAHVVARRKMWPSTYSTSSAAN